MTTPTEFEHAAGAVEELADLFHLLGDATRLRIVLACLAQPTAVGDIAASLDLSSSLVSHHLRLLRAARIVKAERQTRSPCRADYQIVLVDRDQGAAAAVHAGRKHDARLWKSLPEIFRLDPARRVDHRHRNELRKGFRQIGTTG